MGRPLRMLMMAMGVGALVLLVFMISNGRYKTVEHKIRAQWHSLSGAATTTATPPPRRIAIVMMSLGGKADMYDASVTSHQRYAALHGYPLFIDKKNVVALEGENAHAVRMYQKLVTLNKYVLKGLEENDYDWILWNDSDIYITNPGIELESLIPDKVDERQLPDIMAAWDHNGLNAGSMLIRVSSWSMLFFARALAHRVNVHQPVDAQDQGCMRYLLETQADVQARFLQVPDQRWFNAYPKGTVERLWRPQDLLVHMAGSAKPLWPRFANISTAAFDTYTKMDPQAARALSKDDNLMLKNAVQTWWNNRR